MVLRISMTLFRLVATCAVATAALWAQLDHAGAIRRHAADGNMAEAMRAADEWVAADPTNREACAWHARVLTWSGRLDEAEGEFRALLAKVENDSENLQGLASVLNARGDHRGAIRLLERACPDAAASPDCGAARARTLVWLGRTNEARRLFTELHLLDETPRETRYRLQAGGGVDLMSFSSDLSAWTASLSARLNPKWEVEGGFVEWRRFGMLSTGGLGRITWHPGRKTAISVGGESSGRQDIGARAIALLGFDHGFEVSEAGQLRAIELVLEQRLAWYSGTRVLSFAPGVVLYLRHGVDWLVQSTVSQMGAGGRPDWKGSALTRVSFGIAGRLRGRVLAASGAENFGTADQLLFRSSRSVGAGLTIGAGTGKEFRADVRRQAVAGGRSATGFEGGYALRF